MNNYFNISTFLYCTLLFIIPETTQFREKDLSTPGETKVCGTFRNKKLSNALFQDVRILSLNCDSTFSYRHSNCVHPEISSGIWTLHENTVRLSVTNKVKRLVGKEMKTKAGYKYLDLDGVTLAIYDSIITWKRSNKWTDTLYRQ